MPYKIKHMHVQNLRNIIDVSFQDLDENVVKISWNNGAWKSTIVDAIFLAILGKTYIGKGRSIENLVTLWQEKSEIEVTLEWSGKKLRITRKITQAGNTSLEVWSSDPDEKLQQKDLDALLSEFTVDPLEFTRKTKKEQYETIKTITWVDTTSIDNEINFQEEKTKIARAQATEYKKSLENMKWVEKVDRVSTEELAKKQREIMEHNQAVDASNNKIEQTAERIGRITYNIEELEEKLKEYKKTKQDDESYLQTLQEAHKMIWEKLPTEEIEEKIRNADAINAKATVRERYKEIQAQATQKEVELTKQATLLEELREKKKEMIKNADMPIDGMEFTEADGVIINGILFDQYSSAEQLKFACKIATATNPHLRVIYIKDGSLLDSKSMEEMEQFANKEWYQIFIERVGEEAETIIMRDGKALD